MADERNHPWIRLDIASYLASIKDPSVVPYLRRILSTQVQKEKLQKLEGLGEFDQAYYEQLLAYQQELENRLEAAWILAEMGYIDGLGLATQVARNEIYYPGEGGEHTDGYYLLACLAKIYPPAYQIILHDLVNRQDCCGGSDHRAILRAILELGLDLEKAVIPVWQYL